MNFYRIHRLDPERQILYRTTEVMKILGISHPSLRKAILRLGLRPRKRYMSNARRFHYDEVMRVFAFLLTPSKVFRREFGMSMPRWLKRLKGW